MKRSMISMRWPVLAGGLLAAGLLAACADDMTIDGGDGTTDKFVRTADPVPDSYIVVLAGASTERARVTVDDLAADLGVEYAAGVGHTFNGVRMFEARMTEADARALAADPRVVLVEENGHKHVLGSQSNPTWGIDRIDQRDLPLSKSYSWGQDGSGVTAYVIDTGVRITHTELGNRASSGYTSIDDGKGTDDCYGHGTHVAGTIGSATYGVAKNVSISAVRVLDCTGNGTDEQVINGVNWVKEHHSGPSVANMSLGGDASDALDLAIKDTIAAGVVFGLAAGNESQNACNVSPARLPEGITVGATGSSDSRAGYSNFGTCVDIFAPGSNIKSLWNTNDSATSTISGTSMATPHVVGAAALLLAATPTLTPQQVRDQMVSNATPGKVGNPGSGSPNLLLYTGGGGGNPQPGPHSDTFSGTSWFGAWQHQAAIAVTAGSRLRVTLASGSGNADLYVRFGAQPTTSSYDCRPAVAGAETCDLTVPAGTSQAFVSVKGTGLYATFTGTRSWTGP